MFEQLLGWEKRGLLCLVIGAHALSFHGVSRETADLDLLVSRADQDRWEELLAELGYAPFHRGENFAQFIPPAGSGWPVDLMFVQGETFAQMWKEAQEVQVQGCFFRVPSLEHFLALKLHALKHTHPRRTIKDFQDVVGLIRKHPLRIGIDLERTRAMFERYGTLDWYEKVRNACAE